MPMAGLEPARRRRQWILSPPRLPIPTHRHIGTQNSVRKILYNIGSQLSTANKRSIDFSLYGDFPVLTHALLEYIIIFIGSLFTDYFI